MKNWIIPEFEDLSYDAKNFAEWNSIRSRFNVTKNNIKHGRVLNLRSTTALDNMLVETFNLIGQPFVDNDYGWFVWNHKDEYKSVFDNIKIRQIHQGTLIGYNMSLKYNAKTVAFTEKMKNFDRFTQHCMIENKPWSYDEYVSWKSQIELDRMMEEEYRKLY